MRKFSTYGSDTKYPNAMPDQKQENRGKEKSGDGAALVLIKCGSNEKPNLVEHPRRGDDNPEVNAHRDQQVQVARGMRVNQLGIEMRADFKAATIGSTITIHEVRRNEPANHRPDEDRYRELMMRLRSSTRCSKNVICAPASSRAGAMGESDWLLLVMRGGLGRLDNWFGGWHRFGDRLGGRFGGRFCCGLCR